MCGSLCNATERSEHTSSEGTIFEVVIQFIMLLSKYALSRQFTL